VGGIERGNHSVTVISNSYTFPKNAEHSGGKYEARPELDAFSTKRDRRKFLVAVYILNVSNFCYSSYFTEV
jgi:hypothetical protein